MNDSLFVSLVQKKKNRFKFLFIILKAIIVYKI